MGTINQQAMDINPEKKISEADNRKTEEKIIEIKCQCSLIKWLIHKNSGKQ